MLSSEEVHEVLSFELGSAVGAEGLLGGSQGTLGVLETARLEELDDSLLVAGDACHLRDHLPDQLGALADAGLAGDGSGVLGLDACCLMSLIFADGNIGGVALSH